MNLVPSLLNCIQALNEKISINHNDSIQVGKQLSEEGRTRRNNLRSLALDHVLYQNDNQVMLGVEDKSQYILGSLLGFPHYDMGDQDQMQFLFIHIAGIN